MLNSNQFHFQKVLFSTSLTAFDKLSHCACNTVTILTHDWTMDASLFIQRVDALDGTRAGALGSVKQEVVSAAGAVGVSIGAIVTPGVSAERHHQVALIVQLFVICNILK